MSICSLTPRNITHPLRLERKMMATSLSSSQKVDDHMALFSSQMYPAGIYTQTAVVLPQQPVESKPRRRRKKNKGADNHGQIGMVGLKKRKLSEEQVKLLEMSFGDEHKLESERKDWLASELGLDPRQVAVWFQNRRARWKNKKLEDEYNKLKSSHDNIVIEKCQLESEVLKLKEQLLEAEKVIQRLSHERSVDGVSTASPTSSLFMEAMDAPILGEFGVDKQGYDYEDVLYMPQNSYMNGIDWFNLYM